MTYFISKKTRISLLRLSYLSWLGTLGFTWCKGLNPFPMLVIETTDLVSPLPTTTWYFCWKPTLHISSAGLAHCSSDAHGGPDSSVFCSGSSSTLGPYGYGSHRKFFWFTYTDMPGNKLTHTEKFSWVLVTATYFKDQNQHSPSFLVSITTQMSS